MTFVSEHLVRFAHIDAAGIVFYPRYFEMMNAAIEDYFAKEIGVDFKVIHVDRALGVPVVSVKSEFFAPSRLCDALQFHLTVEKVGRSSAEFVVDVRCGEEARFRARVVLVCMDLKVARSLPWPADIRPRESVEAA